MESNLLKVVFLPERTTVHVPAGTGVVEAAGRAGIVFETPCGGNGTCGKCRVVFRKHIEPTPTERSLLSEHELKAGIRLGCQHDIDEEMEIEVPASSRFLGQKILTDGLQTALTVEPSVALDPGDAAGLLCGVAFDIGTTTIVGALMDLTNGDQLGVSSRANPQIPIGDDVISRIGHAENGGLRQLQELVINCVNEMIAEMCRAAGISTNSVYEVSFVGNTTMNHLLLGVDPTQLAQAPYHAVLLESQWVPASQIGVHIRPTGRVYTMANIAGYVGGDTVGVILAAGMHEYDGIELALDIGTNGELVLGGKKQLVTCSTAAGPAFEGARIRHGMRAARGAIESVTLDGDVHLGIIGGGKPLGLCGSGVIDALAALLDAGIVEPSGRMLPCDELPPGLPLALRERITEFNGQPAFVLADERSSGREGPVLFTQRDVREVQVGKAAIAAGVRIILRESGIGLEQVDRILLAGAFGNYVRARSVIRIGLLPQVAESKVHFIGNAAGTGAKMVLAGKSHRRESERIARTARYIELAGRPDFQAEFADAMMFPEMG